MAYFPMKHYYLAQYQLLKIKEAQRKKSENHEKKEPSSKCGLSKWLSDFFTFCGQNNICFPPKYLR